MSGRNRELKALEAAADEVMARKAEVSGLSDAALRNRTWAFRKRLADGETLDSLLPEAYAVVREAARRVLGMEPFRVQLIDGIVLHQGRIAQMCTGEGKTLVAVLPAYLNALTGKGVHVITVNDYLAGRDREQMGRVHEFLGLSVGVVLGGMTAAERKKAYACNITYVTNSELGFDYLRDNMALSDEQVVQRGFHYAIIDEVDSVLIDEARTPLIISGKGARSAQLYDACDVLARRLERGERTRELSKLDMISGVMPEETGDFVIDEKENRAALTASGMERVERFFRIENIADIQNIAIQHHMDLALRANHLLVRDRDYVVKDGEVFIVDGFTGRIMPGRRYSDGLHQAIEAKEHVRIREENRTAASITYQSLFNRYQKKAGMTGTGKTEEKEFQVVYGMDVVDIPTNRPVIRIDREDIVFRTKSEKLAAVCSVVEECAAAKRPVLIGTASISSSEELSAMFAARGIRHNVLNAKYHGQEAAIIAGAGRRGSVTIATNMAGRGTDIKLDDAARRAGGLLVIGTERYESRRIDDQLRGRAGRQGDPGESRFYLSLEDDLLRLNGHKRLETAFDLHGGGRKDGVTHAALSKAVRQAQRRVEDDHFTQRRRLLEYDQVLSEQRETFYGWRRRVLTEREIGSLIEKLLRSAAADAAASCAAGSLAECRDAAVQIFAEVLAPFEIAACERCGRAEDLSSCLGEILCAKYVRAADASADAAAYQRERRTALLQAADRRWMEHIDGMDRLRQSIGLVSYAQKDPLTEYKKEAFRLFRETERGVLYDAAIAVLSRKDGAAV